MADKPIIFSAPMIRALLDGRKTQTRRVLNPQPESPHDKIDALFKWRVGDRLWVQETWNAFTFSEDGECAWPTDTIPTAEDMREVKEAAYRFDMQVVYRESDRAREWFTNQTWRSETQMPRWASRMTLGVTEVRVQRLQEISEADAIREGVTLIEETCEDPREAFRNLWNSLHGPGAWDANPWVACLSFETHQKNIDQMEAKHGGSD